ncbi:MAG TPA: hypothetical protein VN030_11540 [Cellvibrio sp.]|nr:hypothetical protein [Cellvibrio sp.]
MIRKATPQDIAQIIDLATPETQRYPYLKANHDSIKRLVVECVSSANSFAFVSESETGISGAILALTHDNLWAQKQSSTVLAWICKGSGDGIRLLQEYSKWLDGRAAIRRGGFQFDIDVDPKIYRVISRLGFTPHGGCYLKIK